MLQTEITLSQIDYSSAARTVLTAVLDKMSDGNSKLLGVFARHKALSATAAAALPKTFPQDMKDKISVALVEENRAKRLFRHMSLKSWMSSTNSSPSTSCH